MTPRIGEPRLYPGPECPVIYPGETAQARVEVTPEVLAALERGEPVAATEWTVEPMPGWNGRWLRFRYRVWGQWRPAWLPTLTPKLDVAAKVVNVNVKAE